MTKDTWDNETVYDMIDTIEELLEACKLCLPYFEGVWDQTERHPASHLADYVETLQTAIANATGEGEA